MRVQYKVLKKSVFDMNIPDVLYESMGQCSKDTGHHISWCSQTFRRHKGGQFYSDGYIFILVKGDKEDK